MATPLEAELIAWAGALLGQAGWHVGKHAESPRAPREGGCR